MSDRRASRQGLAALTGERLNALPVAGPLPASARGRLLACSFNNKGSAMPGQIIVRPVTRLDYDQWLPLWDGYNAFYGRSRETALPTEITKMTWSRFFDAYEPVHALVAESEARLLGLVHYLYHRSTTAIAPVCSLQDLFTTEAARGKGIGRALIDAVYDRARAAGSGRVYWQTHETNQTAMKLYDKVAERSGFLVYRKLF
jgi:GNAT superfamily N-acetyltransferase